MLEYKEHSSGMFSSFCNVRISVKIMIMGCLVAMLESKEHVNGK